jgi:hypothetical protein
METMVMTQELAQYSKVRIVRLNRSPDEYDGWEMNLRAPKVGDIGCIVDIVRSASETSYVVESSRPDGVTEWIGDFLHVEIRPVENQS